MIAFLFVIYCSVASAFFSRMDGGGAPKTLEFIERSLCAIQYFVIGALTTSPLISSILSYAGAYAGRSTGHGQYFPDLKDKPITPEFLDFIPKLFFGDDPRTTGQTNYDRKKLAKRCFVGMATTGLAVTIIPAIVTLFTLGPLSPVPYLLILSGLLKAVCYQIPYNLNHENHTEIAEYANGAQQGFIAGCCIVIINHL